MEGFCTECGWYGGQHHYRCSQGMDAPKAKAKVDWFYWLYMAGAGSVMFWAFLYNPLLVIFVLLVYLVTAGTQ
jgi:hypothetical protein